MRDKFHLLLVDDDVDILALLEDFFRKHGYQVSAAADGAAMFAALELATIDLVMLDVMLPGEDGLSLCRQVREISTVPIIMLTALDGDTDKIVGLEVGADDYVTKPFVQRELLARVKAVLRRTVEPLRAPTRSECRPMLSFAGWCLDVARRELRSDKSGVLLLSGGEFDLLLAFAEHPQEVLTREKLNQLASGSSRDAYDRTIDVQVSRIRHKLEEDPKNPALIRTVRNGGYVFTAAVTR
jgi:two-component system OmpR family response regulator